MTTDSGPTKRGSGPTKRGPRAAFADSGTGIYASLVAVFCAILIISGIGATKGIKFGPVLTDGGVFLFPISYVIADVLSEVYGLWAARRAVVIGFAVQLMAALTYWLVSISPGAPGYTGQQAFDAVLGVVPRLLLAGVCGYLIGEFLNSFVMVKLKERNKENKLWLRLVSSTIVGEFFDTLVFCSIAGPAIGITGFADLTNYTVLGFVIKTAVELVLVPIVTYPIIAAIKRREPSYAAALAAQDTVAA